MAWTEYYVDPVAGNDYGGATFTDGAWTASTKALVKTGAFPAATNLAGDKLYLEGTGVTAGYYNIATRDSDNQVTLSTSCAAGDLTTVACTQHDGSSTALAWKTVQHALNHAANGTDGRRINVRGAVGGAMCTYESGTAPDYGADILGGAAGSPGTLTMAVIAPAADDPTIIEGYYSTCGDGGMAEIDGNATYAIISTSTLSGVMLRNMKLGNVGANYIVYVNEYGQLTNCWFHTSANASNPAVRANASTVVSHCRFENAVGTGPYAWIGSCSISNCFFVGASYQFVLGNGDAVTNCIFIDPVIQAIRLANITSGTISNCTFFCTTPGGTNQTGIACTANERRQVFKKNIFEGFSGTGGKGIADASTAIMAAVIEDNYFRNNTEDLDVGTAPDVYVDVGNEKAQAATCFAKSGSLTFANRMAYLRLIKIGNVLACQDGGYKGAVRPYASSTGLTAEILKTGEVVDDVTGTYAAGGGGRPEFRGGNL